MQGLSITPILALRRLTSGPPLFQLTVLLLFLTLYIMLAMLRTVLSQLIHSRMLADEKFGCAASWAMQEVVCHTN